MILYRRMVALGISLCLLSWLLIPSVLFASALGEAQAGYAALENGDYDTGIKQLTKALDSGQLSEKNLPIAYFNRGNAWYHKKELDNALADIDKALELDPEFAEGWLKRGQIWKDKGELAKAKEDLDHAIALAPENPKGYFIRGLVHSLEGAALQAMEDFADASRLDPRFIITPLLEAVMEVGVEFGVKFMTKAIESDKLGPANLALTYYYRGLAWYELGGHEQAIDDFTNAIVQNPSLEQAYAARGDAWRQKESYDRAIADYSKAITMQPGNATLHYSRGYALSLAGNYTTALTDFETALQMDPSLEMPDIEALKEHQALMRSSGISENGGDNATDAAGSSANTPGE